MNGLSGRLLPSIAVVLVCLTSVTLYAIPRCDGPMGEPPQVLKGITLLVGIQSNPQPNYQGTLVGCVWDGKG